MNTKELAAIVAQVTEQPKETVEECLRTAFEVIADALSDQEVCKLAGLGRLQVRQVGIERLVRLAPHGHEKRMAPHAVRFRAIKRLRIEENIRAAYA